MERHPRRFYLYAGLNGVTVLFRSKYTSPPLNEIEQFYLLPPMGGVREGQFTVTCPDSHAQTFANMVILFFALINLSKGAMDVLRLLNEVRERE